MPIDSQSTFRPRQTENRPSRRQFLQAGAATIALPSLPTSSLQAQENEWGGPILDIHHHYRNPVEANLAHMDGAGITRSLLLTDARLDAVAAQLMADVPDRFVRFTSANVARQDRFEAALQQLRTALESGSIGLGEMKSQVDLDSPEMRAVYDLATEFNVPVLLHFQEVTQQLSSGTFNMGYERFPEILSEYSGTTFIGHADNFWANISTEVPTDTAYPEGPVSPGGLTDRMLSEFPNLYGDLAATSGRNALARDPEFARGFLDRHQDKLMFGSDCFCADGRGTGQTNPLPLIAGKCVARETLTALKELTSPAVFRKITWENGVRLFGIA